ncbi:MAG: T9SS type A sorting domain-containing protein [Bacteroidales bacterium]|nr:T9SS type A sorting domain-containing protein [Bacteroidales bacterium]
MTNKPLICCVIFLLSGVFSLNAQRKINFQYDASGNRIERTIYLPTANSINQALISDFAEFKVDKIVARDIKIYPNPTKGQLRVDISGLEFSSKDFIAIYSIQGSLLARISPVQSSNYINLESQSPGVYLMVINLDEETVKWKIVKQ